MCDRRFRGPGSDQKFQDQRSGRGHMGPLSGQGYCGPSRSGRGHLGSRSDWGSFGLGYGRDRGLFYNRDLTRTTVIRDHLDLKS